MIAQALSDSAGAHLRMAEHGEYAATLGRVADILHRALEHGRCVYVCGNGGSAADAQHVAGEFLCRFRRDRRPYPVLALTTDTSTLTAIGNDYEYSDVYARQVRAFARRWDVVVGISTSGRSENVIRAMRAAHECEAVAVGFSGRGPSPLAGVCDEIFEAPEHDTARVQELHITAWHAVIGDVEARLCARGA